ncbi:MAG: hypothetical protein P4M08_10345 [Oligoflexia bacterium]|nr:hypothetical protein [Oligoflexia bacterium]
MNEPERNQLTPWQTLVSDLTGGAKAPVADEINIPQESLKAAHRFAAIFAAYAGQAHQGGSPLSPLVRLPEQNDAPAAITGFVCNSNFICHSNCYTPPPKSRSRR